MPSKELLGLRALLLHRHQWVRLRTQIQNALQAIALANGLRRGPSLWSYDGQAKMAFLPLPPHASLRRSALPAMYRHMDKEIGKLTVQVAEQAHGPPIQMPFNFEVQVSSSVNTQSFPPVCGLGTRHAP
jgi:transposase